jgi:hypothetical protein
MSTLDRARDLVIAADRTLLDDPDRGVELAAAIHHLAAALDDPESAGVAVSSLVPVAMREAVKAEMRIEAAARKAVAENWGGDLPLCEMSHDILAGAGMRSAEILDLKVEAFDQARRIYEEGAKCVICNGYANAAPGRCSYCHEASDDGGSAFVQIELTSDTKEPVKIYAADTGRSVSMRLTRESVVDVIRSLAACADIGSDEWAQLWTEIQAAHDA